MTRLTRRKVVGSIATAFPFYFLGTNQRAGDDSSTGDATSQNTTSTPTNERNTDTESQDKQPAFTVSIDPLDSVFEGSIETVTFTVSNPADTSQSEVVTVERGSWTTLYEEPIVLGPGESVSESVTWRVRHDAAGHAMELTVAGSEDTDSTVVSGLSPFSARVDETRVDPDAGELTVTYTIENDGTAPNGHDVTVVVDDVVRQEHVVYLGIGRSQTFTETVPVDPGGHVVEITTESSTTREQIPTE